MKVRDYYKRFGSIFGVLTAAIASFPMTAGLLPQDYARYLFPPIGPGETFFRVATVVLAVLMTLIAYFIKDWPFVTSKRGRIKALTSMLLPAFLGAVLYMTLLLVLVRTVSIPSDSAEIVVSVGYERSTYAVKQFGPASDWELLKQRGPTEEEIWRLWTPFSIVVSRLALMASYLMFLLPTIVIGSLAVVFDKFGVATNP